VECSHALKSTGLHSKWLARSRPDTTLASSAIHPAEEEATGYDNTEVKTPLWPETGDYVAAIYVPHCPKFGPYAPTHCWRVIRSHENVFFLEIARQLMTFDTSMVVEEKRFVSKPLILVLHSATRVLGCLQRIHLENTAQKATDVL
jgi:hypothetical protein